MHFSDKLMDHIVKMQPLPPRPKRAVALTLIGLWSKVALCTLWPLLSLAWCLGWRCRVCLRPISGRWS